MSGSKRMTGRPDHGSIRLVDATFTDIDELCANVRAWDLDFRPLRLSRNSGEVGHIVQSRVGPIEFGHARFREALNQRGSPPSHRITFVVQEKGMRRLWWRGHDTDAGRILIFPVGSELSAISAPDFDVHTISLAETDIAFISDMLGLNLRPPGARPEVVRPAPALLDELRRALRAIRDRFGATTADHAWWIANQLVGAWLLPSPKHKRPAIRERDLAVRRCMDALQHPDWLELSTADLCALSGVSERTLQYAFRERFGLSPAAFMKAQRLAGVHAALAEADPARSSVGDTASRFGFWHVGQFAADYRCAFGKLPSETLGRLACTAVKSSCD